MCKKNNEPYLIRDSHKLIDINFYLMIETLDDIEKEIKSSLISSFLSLSKNTIIYISGNNFEIKGQKNNFSFFFNDANRTLSLNFIPLEKTNPRLDKYTIKINHVGKIRILELNASKKILNSIKHYLDTIAEKLKIDYLFLENSLLENYLTTSEKLTSKLYGLLDTAIKARNKEKLIGQYWFAVGQIPSAKRDDGLFSFSINKDNFKLIMDKLKKNQHQVYSPTQILKVLISNEVPDDGIDFIRNGLMNSNISFSDLTIKNEDNFEFWISEKLMFNSEGVGFYYFKPFKSYMVHVNYRIEIKSLIEPIIVDIKEEIENQIRENAKFMKSIKVFTKENKSHLLSVIRQFIIDFGAKLSSELIKQ